MAENDTETPAIPAHPTGLRARGKRLWADMNRSGDFRDCPEVIAVIEQACFLADEIKRLQTLIRKAGADTRVTGYNGQPASMPEVADLQRNQQLYLSYLKSIRVSEEDGKLTRSEIGKIGAGARWSR